MSLRTTSAASIHQLGAAAAFARPNGDRAELASGPLVRGIIAAEGGHMIPSAGAVPIFRDDRIEGACGVGGASDQQDGACARAGAA